MNETSFINFKIIDLNPNIKIQKHHEITENHLNKQQETNCLNTLEHYQSFT